MFYKNKNRQQNFQVAYKSILKLYKEDLDFEKTINGTFKIMGELLDVDILEMHVYNNRYKNVNHRLYWKNNRIRNKQYMDTDAITFKKPILEKLKDKPYIKINDTRKLPKELENYALFYKLFHVKSVCAFPIVVDDKLIASLVIKYQLKPNKFKDNVIYFTLKCKELMKKRIEQEYKAIMIEINKKHYYKAIENYFYPILLIDYQFNLIQTNKAFEKLFKISKDELEKYNIIDFLSTNDRLKIIDLLKRGMNLEKSEYDIFKMIGGKKKIIRMFPVPFQDPQLELLSIAFKDVTEEKQKEAQLFKLAYFDDVTNLYNRKYFLRKCSELDFEVYETLGIVVVDIVQFSDLIISINRKNTEKIVEKIARVIKDVFFESYLIFRNADDEFIILMMNKNREYIQQRLDELNNRFTTCSVYQHVAYSYSFCDNIVVDIDQIIENTHNKLFLQINNKENIRSTV